ncbi:Ca(2+)-dependent cysteine protease [Phlyctochytrium planicorne]|nr:Ca(2+)-dependent cysteine protease [Phlyctochytrium planicorne]
MAYNGYHQPRVTLVFLGFPPAHNQAPTGSGASRRAIVDIPSSNGSKPATLLDIIARAKREQFADDHAVDLSRASVYTGPPDFAQVRPSTSAGLLRDGDFLMVVCCLPPKNGSLPGGEGAASASARRNQPPPIQTRELNSPQSEYGYPMSPWDANPAISPQHSRYASSPANGYPSPTSPYSQYDQPQQWEGHTRSMSANTRYPPQSPQQQDRGLWGNWFHRGQQQHPPQQPQQPPQPPQPQQQRRPQTPSGAPAASPIHGTGHGNFGAIEMDPYPHDDIHHNYSNVPTVNVSLAHSQTQSKFPSREQSPSRRAQSAMAAFPPSRHEDDGATYKRKHTYHVFHHHVYEDGKKGGHHGGHGHGHDDGDEHENRGREKNRQGSGGHDDDHGHGHGPQKGHGGFDAKGAHGGKSSGKDKHGSDPFGSDADLGGHGFSSKPPPSPKKNGFDSHGSKPAKKPAHGSDNDSDFSGFGGHGASKGKAGDSKHGASASSPKKPSGSKFVGDSEDDHHGPSSFGGHKGGKGETTKAGGKPGGKAPAHGSDDDSDFGGFGGGSKTNGKAGVKDSQKPSKGGKDDAFDSKGHGSSPSGKKPSAHNGDDGFFGGGSSPKKSSAGGKNAHHSDDDPMDSHGKAGSKSKQQDNKKAKPGNDDHEFFGGSSSKKDSGDKKKKGNDDDGGFFGGGNGKDQGKDSGEKKSGAGGFFSKLVGKGGDKKAEITDKKAAAGKKPGTRAGGYDYNMSDSDDNAVYEDSPPPSPKKRNDSKQQKGQHGNHKGGYHSDGSVSDDGSYQPAHKASQHKAQGEKNRLPAQKQGKHASIDDDDFGGSHGGKNGSKLQKGSEDDDSDGHHSPKKTSYPPPPKKSAPPAPNKKSTYGSDDESRHNQNPKQSQGSKTPTSPSKSKHHYSDDDSDDFHHHSHAKPNRKSHSDEEADSQHRPSSPSKSSAGKSGGRPPQKKAVLIGINYTGTKVELKGCINDVKAIHQMLVSNLGYEDSSDTIRILTDDAKDPKRMPTKKNILEAIAWLRKDIGPRDSLYFHFSGHGSQQESNDSYENLDETLVPVDYLTAGQIIDNDLNDRLVHGLPKGIRMTCVFDCCHSGTILDLPYQYSADGKLLGPPNLTDQHKSLKGRSSEADVVLLSGCKDSQTSADASFNGQAEGALTFALLETLKKNAGHKVSFLDILRSVRDIMKRRKFSQVPQLSASHEIDFFNNPNDARRRGGSQTNLAAAGNDGYPQMNQHQQNYAQQQQQQQQPPQHQQQYFQQPQQQQPQYRSQQFGSQDSFGNMGSHPISRQSSHGTSASGQGSGNVYSSEGYGYSQGYQQPPQQPRQSAVPPMGYSHSTGGMSNAYRGVDMSNTGSGPSKFMSQQPNAGFQPPQNQQQQGMGSQFFGASQFTEFQNSAAGQIGMQFGAQALQQGQQIVNQNINRYVNMTNLRRYFNVSNSFVLNKIRVLLFPFRNRTWTRLVNRSEHDGQMEGFKPPREDLNAPDLYIPVMAFVTYVLLIGALYGISEKFKPEALGLTSTTALFITGVEILFFKLGCYLLNVTSDVLFLDLVAYCGYKYVPIIGVLVPKLFNLNGWAIYGTFAYLMLAYGFFTLRTMRHIVLPESNSTVNGSNRQRRIYFLFIVVGFQILTAFFLVSTGSPKPHVPKPLTDVKV